MSEKEDKKSTGEGTNEGHPDRNSIANPFTVSLSTLVPFLFIGNV